MLLWLGSIFFFFCGARSLFSGTGALSSIFRARNETQALMRVTRILHELQETLEAGLVPTEARWAELKRLPEPWSGLAYRSLHELRVQGGALLPTLKRLRALAEEHRTALQDARAKAAQALAQALVCAALVPLFATTLYLLLPGIGESRWTWLIASLLALVCAALGALWLLSMAESARWGGLPEPQRAGWLASLCAGERFLALVRSGMPGDLAWTRSCESLAEQDPTLARLWGFSVWEPACDPGRPCAAAASLIAAGSSMKKAIQVSVMEGRPCGERVEGALRALRQEMKAHVERELALLGTRAMKPLFVCVAPALLGLLAFGLYLGWSSSVEGFGGA